MANSGRPEANEYGPFYRGYIDLVTESDICEAAETSARDMAALLAGIGEERWSHRYAPEKWSIKQLVGHVTDGERVFAYRTLCIARGETQSLPGFDETDYMRNSNFDRRPFAELVAELNLVRQASIAMLRGFDPAVWQNAGVANNQPITARGVAYAMVGHARHHMNILRQRYIAT